jgi:hypothetical protein
VEMTVARSCQLMRRNDLSPLAVQENTTSLRLRAVRLADFLQNSFQNTTLLEECGLARLEFLCTFQGSFVERLYGKVVGR